MKLWHAELLFPALLLSLSPFSACGSWANKSYDPAGLHSPPEVRDEADPRDTRSCYAMGQLELSYHTQDGLPPNVGMLVTDPRERRIGYDPAGPNAWQELPQAQAFVDCADQDADGQPRSCVGWIQICGPVSGTYTLEIIASEDSKYSIDVSAVSSQQRDGKPLQATESRIKIEDEAIRKGFRQEFLLDYSREPGSKVAVRPVEDAPVAQKNN
jgi:hypothetical protein